MIRIGEPKYLYLLFLLIPFLFFLVWAWKKKQLSAALFAERNLSPRLSKTVSQKKQKLKNIFLFLSVAMLIFSLSRPQAGFRWEEVKRRGFDVVIAADLSKSMLAQDVSPSRIERARRKIIDFLGMARGDRVGLIGFSGRAFVLSPLTLDYGAIRLFADQLSPELIKSPGTALSDAIELGVKALSKGSPQGKGIIIISDGEDLGGDVTEAAQKAAEVGVKIYTLGVGKTEGAPIPISGGGFQKENGEVVLSKLDEKKLADIAGVSGGKYVRSVANDKDILEIYSGIKGDLEEHELKESKRKVYIDRFQFFIAAALILLLIATFMSESRTDKKRRFQILRKLLPSVVLITTLLAPASSIAFGNTGKIREGERFYKEGKFESALELFLSAQVDRPDDVRLKYNIANTYYKLGKFDEAGKIFNSIPLEKRKDLRERAVYNRGNSEYRNDKLEQAIKSYEEALKIDPNDEDAKYNLEFVKKMLEQRKQEEEKQDNEKQDEDQKQKQDEKKDQDKEQKQEQEQKQQQQEDQNKQKDQKEEDSQNGGKKDQPEDQQRQQENDQKKNEQDENGKRPETQDVPAKNEQGGVSKEEANMWLSTVKEGKRQKFPATMTSEGSRESRKDW